MPLQKAKRLFSQLLINLNEAKMAINNYEKILPLITFGKANNLFMFLQIIRRPKDHNGDVTATNRVMASYTIRCQEDLKRLMPEIILLCEHYGARAYIEPGIKSYKEVSKNTLMRTAENLCHDNYRNPLRFACGMIGETKPDQKVFLIDVDCKDDLLPVYRWLDIYILGIGIAKPEDRTYLLAEIPTVHGYHLITTPFNKKDFGDEFPHIEVKVNAGGTLLYYPDSLNTKGTPEGSSIESWYKWIRQAYGIAINIIAHDGGEYTWELVYLPNYRGDESGINVGAPLTYPSYEEAQQDAVLKVIRKLGI